MVEILAEPTSQIVNISVGSKFPAGCKTAKVISIFTKRKKYRTKELQACFTSVCNN